jgi:hypothetical protein|tara:strand:- start:520 stop:1059 length:540 start_codon:yes stop_codon:yes gene_type:complete
LEKKYCQSCGESVLASIRKCPKCGSKDIGMTANTEYIPKDEYKSSRTSQNKPKSSPPSSNTYPNSSSQPYLSDNSSSFVSNFVEIGGGALAMIIFFGFGIVQVVSGYIGIEHEFGAGWAFFAIALFIMLRISLPLMIGMFLCATNVWGWHWFYALLFTAPTLVFLIPGMIGAMIEGMRK